MIKFYFGFVYFFIIHFTFFINSMASFGEGDAVKDLMWFIGVIVVLGLFWFVSGGPIKYQKSGGTASSTATSSIPNIIPWSGSETATYSNNVNTVKNSPPVRSLSRLTGKSGDETDGTSVNPNDSVNKGRVTISLGQSGENTNSTNKEYVILRANRNNSAPVNITGWKIDNGQGSTYSDSSGQLVRRDSARITIPSGTQLLSGVTKSVLAPIKLNPGDTAYVITGGVVGGNPYVVDASFRVNKCSGYLANLSGYNFTPRISGSCPEASDEVNLNSLPKTCYNFINSTLGSNCRTPNITTDPKTGTLVNGQSLTSFCQNLVVENFNYGSCISKHLRDSDFYKDTWYVFLRANTTGLWARNRATITLYDSIGKIVDEYEY